MALVYFVGRLMERVSLLSVAQVPATTARTVAITATSATTRTLRTNSTTRVGSTTAAPTFGSSMSTAATQSSLPKGTTGTIAIRNGRRMEPGSRLFRIVREKNTTRIAIRMYG